MVARAHLASLVLVAIAATSAFAQDASLYVEVTNQTQGNQSPSTQDALLSELESTRTDALVLYSDYASRAGMDVKAFLKNITGYADEVLKTVGVDGDNDSDECGMSLKYRLKKIEHDARRGAVYSGESHHKFLLGHMIVFRMHLNKSDDYLKKCDKVIRSCGLPCENTPRVRRWRRLAMEEINRVRDDMQHSKKSYRDLVSHARRKLNHLRKQALSKGQDALEEYRSCVNN